VPYKMRMQFLVDVDITGTDNNDAWTKLDKIKNHLRWALSTSVDSKDRNEMSKTVTIVDAHTHFCVKEEYTP
jgi:hypothetical protein